MVQQELITYMKDAKAQGHSFESVKTVLTQLGWSEQDIADSALVVSAPVAPAPVAPVPHAPMKKVEKKIPDYYISPLSVLLAIILFLSLYTLTGQIMDDIESVVAPYAAETVGKTAVYEDLLEKYSRNIPPDELLRVQTKWSAQHQNDRVTHLFVAGILSAVFWGIAFAIHFAVGSSRREYLPLSVPFFSTAGIYLVVTLIEVISRLFERDAQYAVYATLIMFIIIVTVAFMFYQKRSHAEKTL